MRITDSQVHIWKENSPERPWLPGVAAHRSPALGMEALLGEMDAAGVERCVLVPPTLDADRNDYCLEAAQKHPARASRSWAGSTSKRPPPPNGSGRGAARKACWGCASRSSAPGWAQRSGKAGSTAVRDLDKLLAVARRPNCAVKVSALPAYTNDTYPFRRVHPYVRRVYDSFGPRRMFW
ncbi:MAG: hypothetical protein EHM59_20760, partial [Betaproteobacteria bacterium]